MSDDRAMASTLVEVWTSVVPHRQQAWEALSASELARLQALRLPMDRQRFVTGCLLLRTALSRKLEMPAAVVPIDRTCPDCGGQHGKPTIPGTSLEVSISHSGIIVMVGVSEGLPVGVDIEQTIRFREMTKHANRVLSDREQAVMNRKAARAHPAFIARNWVRKEAITKAAGVGLRIPLNHITVTRAHLGSRLEVDCARHSTIPRGIALRDIRSPRGYVASLAVFTGGPLRVRVLSAATVRRWGEAR